MTRHFHLFQDTLMQRLSWPAPSVPYGTRVLFCLLVLVISFLLTLLLETEGSARPVGDWHHSAILTARVPPSFGLDNVVPQRGALGKWALESV